MKTYWGVEVQLCAFSTSALDGDEWSASRPGRFIPRYPLDRGLGGPRPGLDAVVKSKMSASEPHCPARRLVTILTELPRLRSRKLMSLATVFPWEWQRKRHSVQVFLAAHRGNKMLHKTTDVMIHCGLQSFSYHCDLLALVLEASGTCTGGGDHYGQQ